MGAWFSEGRMEHLLTIANYDNGRLYDHEVARKVLGEGIAEASEAGNLARLGCVLDFPSHLIDEANPAIAGVAKAYAISRQSRE